MDKLKRFFRKVVIILSRPMVIWAIALIVIVIAGVLFTIHGNSTRRANEAARLEKLSQQQKLKAKQQTKLDQMVQQHSDVFTDISDAASTTTSCDRLKNRPGIILTNGCNYYIRAHGKLTMAVVFVYEGDVNTSFSMNALRGPANDQLSLNYINTFLKAQAARYGVKDPAQIDMTFYGPYRVTSPVVTLPYYERGTDIKNIFQSTADANKVPRSKYDMVHYVLLNSVYGGVAFPGQHEAFTENGSITSSVFIHETLHLLGASDKYNNNDCNTIGSSDPFGRYNGSLPGADIMCESFSIGLSVINDITAREIGWQN